MAGSHPLTIQGDGDEPANRLIADLPLLPDAGRKPFVFTQHWTQHQPVIRAYLASFLGNCVAVDDALQEVAVVVWQKGPVEADATSFLRYSLACARRIALAACRRRGDPRLELLSPEAAAMLADQVVFQEEQETERPDHLMLALRRCMESIKPEHRELLESRYSGESRDELDRISKRSGKSMDSIYKTLERLRERLRACVERRLTV